MFFTYAKLSPVHKHVLQTSLIPLHDDCHLTSLHVLLAEEDLSLVYNEQLLNMFTFSS
jgi:hypothetical protein